jgi:hypothetical protein
MTRPKGQPNYDPSTCIWAALRAQGLLTVRQASDYRRGARKPTRVLRAAWRALGYDVGAGTWPEMGSQP